MSDSITLVKSTFPDANEWLDVYGQGILHVGELVHELNYKHGIELMTGCVRLVGTMMY